MVVINQILKSFQPFKYYKYFHTTLKISNTFEHRSSLLPGINQTKCDYSNDEQSRSVIFVSFLTNGVEIFVKGRGHIDHIIKM